MGPTSNGRGREGKLTSCLLGDGRPCSIAHQYEILTPTAECASDCSEGVLKLKIIQYLIHDDKNSVTCFSDHPVGEKIRTGSASM